MEHFKNYKKSDRSLWSGRVDSVENYDAFRWHQWVQLVDLNHFEIDLKETEIGIGFLGFCSDEGVRRNLGRTGAKKGPESIRRELVNLPCSFSKRMRLFDFGDILLENEDLEKGQADLADAVSRILDAGIFPIVLGGGHETAFGTYSGVYAHLKDDKKKKMGILNFDAHFDLRPYEQGGSSGTMFRQIADSRLAKGEPFSYFCLGLQKHSNTVELFKTADRLCVDYILAKDIIGGDDWATVERLDQFAFRNESIYITICADVFSTAFAPGVSAAQSLGLDPEKVLRFIKSIMKSKKLVAFDFCEVSPRFDQDNATADLASVIIYTIVTTMDSYE